MCPADVCMFWKGSSFPNEYLVLLWPEALLTQRWWLPLLTCLESHSVSKLNCSTSSYTRVEDGQGYPAVETSSYVDWRQQAGFVKGAEEQGQWLLQFVVLVNCWIGTGLFCGHTGQSINKWKKLSGQKKSKWSSVYPWVVFFVGRWNYFLVIWTRTVTAPHTCREIDQN